MRNPSLLRFMGAVRIHTETGKTLMTASGYDPVDLQLAVAVAQERGFVEPTGEIQPSLRITSAGQAWVDAELGAIMGAAP